MTGPGSPPDFGVIVIGAGGAGLAAALSAAEAGASVLLVEATGIPGGSTRLSSGSFMAAGTEIQAALGFTDDARAFFDHYLCFNRWICDPAVARRFCEDGWPTMKWLAGHGVEYPESGLYRATREAVPRSHRPAGGGQAVIDVLVAACHRAGVEIALGNRATRLLTDSGRVYGVEARGEHASAAAVVLASGGFARNEDLLARYYPRFAAQDGHWSPAPDANVGDGLLMGREVGAAIVGRSRGITVLTPGLSRERDPFPPGWLVYVNEQGQRFIDESAPYSVMSHAAGRYEGGVWNVFDDRARRGGAGNLIGEQYLGGGNAVGGALTFGRIAGLQAAAMAGVRCDAAALPAPRRVR